MKLKYQFIVREVKDRFVAVAVGDNADDFHAIIKVNKTGKVMLELLKDDITKEEMLAKLAERYDAPEELLSSEMEKFLGVLRENSVLVE